MNLGTKKVAWARASGPLLALGCVLAACSAKSTSSTHDAGVHDAAATDRDAGVDATGPDATDSSVALDSSLAPLPDGATHPNKCTGPSNCENGQICCSAIGGLVVDSACTTGSTCPSGFVEVCGAHGGEHCVGGSCREYFCTVDGSHLMSTIYACDLPVMIPDETCTQVPDGGFFSPDARSLDAAHD